MCLRIWELWQHIISNRKVEILREDSSVTRAQWWLAWPQRWGGVLVSSRPRSQWSHQPSVKLALLSAGFLGKLLTTLTNFSPFPLQFCPPCYGRGIFQMQTWDTCVLFSTQGALEKTPLGSAPGCSGGLRLGSWYGGMKMWEWSGLNWHGMLCVHLQALTPHLVNNIFELDGHKLKQGSQCEIQRSRGWRVGVTG